MKALAFNMFCFFVCSMEQSVGQTANINHATELDQILASYKVCVDFSYVGWRGFQTCYALPFCYKL